MDTKLAHTRPFGIVQGRLTIPPAGLLQWFPKDCWQEEFSTAERLGIQFIELLTERQYNPDNPFWTESGRAELKALNTKTGRLLYSSCTDYIIDHSLLLDPKGQTLEHVQKFLEASADLGCKVAVFPLLEQSDLNTSSANTMVPLIREFARQAAKSNILICIESLMEGKHLKAFLEKVSEPNVRCVFDTGNRVVHNQDLAAEIHLLNDWIAHVHIKDKNDSGVNVLMGTGCVNFAEVFKALYEIDYDGPLVFETTRGIDPSETAVFHMATCNFFSREARNG
jgi:sugar phosphate isomerase/epimerase